MIVRIVSQHFSAIRFLDVSLRVLHVVLEVLETHSDMDATPTNGANSHVAVECNLSDSLGFKAKQIPVIETAAFGE